jgi:hypothetical protein
MTTLAYRDGVLAADSGVWIGDATVSWPGKLLKVNNVLYGATGDVAQATEVFTLLKAGQPMPHKVGDWVEKDSRSSLLILMVDVTGNISVVGARGTERYDGMPYFAHGAGNVGALCAMHVGATAEQAIEAAIEHAMGAIGPVRSIRFGDDP